MNRSFVVVLLLISGAAEACTWNGRAIDYNRFSVYAAFYGELVERGEERDQLGRVTRRWGEFRPVKPIWGTWSTERRVYFEPDVSSLQLLPGRVYHLHVSQNGQYAPPCGYGALDSYASVEDPRFQQSVAYTLEAMQQ